MQLSGHIHYRSQIGSSRNNPYQSRVFSLLTPLHTRFVQRWIANDSYNVCRRFLFHLKKQPKNQPKNWPHFPVALTRWSTPVDKSILSTRFPDNNDSSGSSFFALQDIRKRDFVVPHLAYPAHSHSHKAPHFPTQSPIQILPWLHRL